MERLSLIVPPENMETYNTKSFCTRKRSYHVLSVDGWVDFFAHGAVHVRWVVPWWRIPRMVGSSSSAAVRISGLRTFTHFLPHRLARQYGRRQLIPDVDSIMPVDTPVLGHSASRWESYWMDRPRVIVQEPKESNWVVSRHYIIWMTSDNSVRRAEARVAEKKQLEIENRPCTRKPNIDDYMAKRSVKARLGVKITPVWERLSRAPKETEKKKVTTDPKRKRDEEEILREIVREESPRKKYVWRKKGESSKKKEKEGEKEKGKGKEKEE